MDTTIDNAGRVVIPKAVREALGLANGGRVVVYLEEGRIVIEPAAVEKRLVRRGRGLVCVADGELPVLTTDEVRAVLEASRR